MSLYVFNNQQAVIKVIKYKRLIEGTQIQELNGTDELTVEIPNKDWDALEEEPLYLAIRDAEKRFSFHMYKIIQEDVNSDSVTVSGIQIGYDEMKAYGYIKDRRFTQASMQNVANAIVDGTDWQTGFVDSDLPSISTNFYYISRLEAIRKVIEANGCEVRFRVEITGNRIVAKRIDFLKRMSSDKGKRFSYGSKLLSVVKEKDSAELYTALVGRGKGEEVGDGYGRRIGFEDIEWSVANGDPVDKPLGQEFVELPDMTALYGFPDGEPRTSIVTFEDTEDEALLLEQTYEKAVEMSRPQVQFKATVQLIGDAELGETVSIIRHDLNFKYKTRIFKVKRDLLNNNRTEIELGDRITESLGRTIRRIDTTNQRREERIVEYVQNTADGKNKIFRQAATPDTGMTVNDLWYKPVGEGETELYRWNGNIWELEKVSAGLLGGTLDAENGDVNLINVNVANIVGETSEFVRSAWNSATGGNVAVTGSGVVSTAASGAQLRVQNGVVLTSQPNGATIGYIGYDQIGTSPRYTVQTSRGSHFQVRQTYENDAGQIANRATLLMNPRQTLLDTDNFQIIGGTQSIGFDFKHYISGTSENTLMVTGKESVALRANESTVLQISNDGNRNHASLYADLNMQGNTIINQSDIRLKKDIEDSTLNALQEIERLKFVEYIWDKEKEVNKEKPEGRQFGIIAQYSPFLQTKAANSESYLSVDILKQINLNSKALQEMNRKVNEQQKEIDELKALIGQLTGTKE